MNKKTMIVTLLAALSLAALVVGCGGRNERSALYGGGAMKAASVTSGRARADEGYAYNDSAMREQMAYDMVMPEAAAQMEYMAEANGRVRGQEAGMAEEEINVAERKLVKSASVRIRVESLETADASVTDLMQQYDAYAASTSIRENEHYYSLRVPAVHYDAFLAAMNGMGRLLHRSENIEDVTLRYYDLEGRLENKKELLKTFQSYLGKAKTIEEILAVEARISDLQYDIEGTGVQFRNLANRVDYAAVDLNLIGPVAAASNQNVTFGERLRQMFGGFGAFLAGVAVAIVGIVIYGIPVLLLAVLFFWLLLGRVGLLKKLWRLVMKK